MRRFRLFLRNVEELAAFAAIAFFSFPIITAIIKVLFMG